MEPEHVLRSGEPLPARGGLLRPDVYDHAAAAHHGGQRLRQRRLSHEAVCCQERRQQRRGGGRVQFTDRGAPGRERADECHRAPDPRAGRWRPRRRHRQERLRCRLPYRRQDRHVGKGRAGRGRRREGVHRLVHRLRPGGRPADRHPRAARHAEQQHRHLHQRRPDGRAHRRQNDGGHPAVPRRGAVVLRDGKDAHG